MQAVKLMGIVDSGGALHVTLPEDFGPGPVEVIVLQEVQARTPAAGAGHPAFGIWADRGGEGTAAEFAATVRRRLESREDGRG